MLLYVYFVYYATRVINAACLLRGSLEDVGKMPSGKSASKLLSVIDLLAGVSSAVPVRKGLCMHVSFCSVVVAGELIRRYHNN